MIVPYFSKYTQSRAQASARDASRETFVVQVQGFRVSTGPLRKARHGALIRLSDFVAPFLAPSFAARNL
jgi:hypothetical protein